MNTQNGAFDTAVQTELMADAEFQTKLAGITDETEKATAIEQKKAEILNRKAPEWFAEMQKQATIAEDQRKRAEKAEGKPPKDDKTPDKKDDDLSSMDVIALVNAQINHPDDIAEIRKAAALFGKSIPETIADPLVAARLKQAKEFRASQEAMNVDPKRPGSHQPTDAEIIERANKGEVFKPGSPEAEQLYWARRGGKRSR